jgi:hypothetical protein
VVSDYWVAHGKIDLLIVHHIGQFSYRFGGARTKKEGRADHIGC